MGTQERILQILRQGGYKELTLLQKYFIPMALQNRNIIAEAGKNTGKTVSYIIPIVINLENSDSGLRVLVIASAQDEVKKIQEQFSIFLQKMEKPLQAVSFIKDKNIKNELLVLEQKPDILISTPDKIINHLRLGNFDINNIDICVIDNGINPYEGFEKDIEFIISELPQKTHYWLFTDNREMIASFNDLMSNPSILYSEQEINTSRARQENRKKTMNFTEEQEKNFSEIIQKIVKKIKEDEDPNELNAFKKIVKKNVPFTLRSYFSAYLFKQMVSGNATSRPQHNTAETAAPAPRPSMNKPDRNYKTLFFNIGRSRGLNLQALRKFIIATANIDPEEIGQIKVHDNYSFVDITEETAQAVMDGINSKVYRGRTLAVNFAKKAADSQKTE